MVAIQSLLGAAAIFSVAFAAPSGRLSQRSNHEEKLPSYEESYKGYEDNRHTQILIEKGHETRTAERHEITRAPERHETRYEEVKHETRLEEIEHETFIELPEHETRTIEDIVTRTIQHESRPTYGSGHASWDSQGYEDCVSKCLANYGNKDSWYKPSTTVPEGSSEESAPDAEQSAGSVGTGATHTVIVAPTQGVLRYIPFAVNASVGDTIKFMWGANNHTVTKGSSLLPCNKSGDSLFTSGPKNKDFVFTQVVNTTEPTYFFCNTPSHCQKGMFGIINPPREAGAPTSASSLVQDLQASNPDLKAYASIVDEKTLNNAAARSWGGDISIGTLPNWAQSLAAENIYFTRSVLAANPELLKEDGRVDLGSVDSTPLFVPDDVAVALSNAASSPAPSLSLPATPPAQSTSATPSDAATGASAQNSASSLASPKVLVAVMAVVATFLAL